MGSAIEDLLKTMARLRGPGGCPWDHEQTHRSLCEPLIEETAELLDTIDREDYDHMREELGDVLLQVVFHSQIAAEAGRFDFEAVAREINDKLVRRHPHVFGESAGGISDAGAVVQQWEEIKAAEKRNGPVFTGIFKPLPPALPALTYAWNVAKQIDKKALQHADLPDASRVAELASGLTEDDAGQRLFECIMAMRKVGMEPESVLRRYTSQLVHEIESSIAST